jgi:magnesium transporter
VGDAIAAVREADQEEVGEIHEVFVVDSDGRLVGTVSPADLLHGEADQTIRSILEPNPISAPLSMDQERIAELVREHDLATIPVVDEWDVLVGQVSHDDVADVIEEEATEDIARMAGSDPEELYGDSVVLSIRSRAPWLIPAFVGGLLASLIIASMEEALADALILAAFLPVVIGMAGGVGTQAAVVTVRSLALGRIEFKRLRHVFVREGLTGLALGILFGLLLFVFTLVTETEAHRVEVYAMTLGVAICAAMTVGTLFGVLVPLSLHRIGIDPAIATTPFVQTANDVLGVGVLFWVAHALGLIG